MLHGCRSSLRSASHETNDEIVANYIHTALIGDEIKIDAYEGTVEEIQTRATIIKTYDERRVVIPNADLFTHSVIVNTAGDVRRWEYDLSVKGVTDLGEFKSVIINAVRKVPGTLSEPSPEVLVLELSDLEANVVAACSVVDKSSTATPDAHIARQCLDSNPAGDWKLHG